MSRTSRIAPIGRITPLALVALAADHETTRFEGGAPAGDRVGEKLLLARLQLTF